MLIEQISYYEDFVFRGRPYYPFLENNILVVSNFSKNAHQTGMHSCSRLICKNVVVVNHFSFCAVYNCNISNQGLRERWFYFRRGRRITWRELTWDEKCEVCRKFSHRRFAGDIHHEALSPCREWLSWCNLAIKWGVRL